MKLIAELSDGTFGLKPSKVTKWRTRRAARTVMLNEKGEVVLVHAKKFDYYKIPGGGIEGSETIQHAAKREALEETGYKIELGKPLGVIIEHRSRKKLRQISYCFLSHTVGKPNAPKFIGEEIREKFEPFIAKSLDDAILIMNRHKRPDLPYLAKFMVKRESLFLKRAKSYLLRSRYMSSSSK